GATDPQYRTRIFTISEEALFRLSTLTYVSGLASPADIEDEPWVTDSDLFGAMDTVDLFTRLDEEHERIRLELDNMLIWYKEVEYELHARIEVEPSGLSGPEMANQAQFVGRLLSEHRSTLAHWAARSLKIAGQTASSIAAIQNERTAYASTRHVAHFDHVLNRHHDIATSMATWEHQLPLPLSVAAKASLLVDDDNLNADQGSGLHAADADDDEDDGETDFPDHPLDRHSAP
ncbi:unnamed protein product, partial [Tilletia controversa]